MVEVYEENIEDWYNNQRGKVSLTDFLCERVILKDDDKSCLTEVFVPGKEEKKEEKKKSEPDEKNNRDSQVIKEAINKAIKEQSKDAKQDL